LRTSDALSKAVVAQQVLGSIIMFVLIYALLFAVWLFVLDSKIKQGPEPPHEMHGVTTKAELVRLAAHRAGAGGTSLTKD